MISPTATARAIEIAFRDWGSCPDVYDGGSFGNEAAFLDDRAVDRRNVADAVD